MPSTNPWNSYRQIATQTAPPGQLILMLYEGALRFLECSLAGFACTDPAEFNMTIHNNLQRAQKIIQELNRVLDMEKGGDCAANLRRLYDYLERRIWESNLKKRPEGIKEVISRLTVLRDAWATILTRQTNPAQEIREPLTAQAAA